MEHAITYVGLDVHKDTIAVASAEGGQRGEVREYGKIANTPAALRALVAVVHGSAAEPSKTTSLFQPVTLSAG